MNKWSPDMTPYGVLFDISVP